MVAAVVVMAAVPVVNSSVKVNVMVVRQATRLEL
jgi:hypothetical protein